MLPKARYAVNPSRREAYSIFVAETLAVGTPAMVSIKVAENLKAETKPLHVELVIAEKSL